MLIAFPDNIIVNFPKGYYFVPIKAIQLYCLVVSASTEALDDSIHFLPLFIAFLNSIFIRVAERLIPCFFPR